MAEPVMRRWLADGLPDDVERALARVRQAEDVRRVAVMPDVHLARGVCVGTVLATSRLAYPSAVGGDIGCGMAAVAFDRPAAGVREHAPALLRGLRKVTPIGRHASPPRLDWLRRAPLSDPALNRLKLRDGWVQAGTLGRGNHFIELQEDEADGRLWLMIHSGSRAMGQAISQLHLSRYAGVSMGLPYLDAATDAGRAYLHDMGWGRAYAELNRQLMVFAVAGLLERVLDARMIDETFIGCDHNHVRVERHFGQRWHVHRKGAAPARKGQWGLIPGSMGSASYHVRGLGCAEALCSSSHGAGRVMSRNQARRRISSSVLKQQMHGVAFNLADAARLRDEAPRAYRDIDRVMKAQRDLVTVVRRLRPVLVYKAG